VNQIPVEFDICKAGVSNACLLVTKLALFFKNNYVTSNLELIPVKSINKSESNTHHTFICLYHG